MVNGSAVTWLRERKDSLPPLDWLTRMKIALGAAKGLAYLHHKCPRKIIHRDVKASNILLDENFEAVLADLSLGEFVDCYGDDIVIPIKGTAGHIAPEYLANVKRYNSQSLEYYFERELEIGQFCSQPMPNLVHVIGFCRMPEVQLLVFPLVVNGSVDSWLTDDNVEAIVADFKSAKIMDRNVTHITTTVTGTIGHIAPEYLASGKCSDKTDVFSYGVFLLELITGRRIIDLIHVGDENDRMCVDWVKRNYEERRWESLADNEGGDDFMGAAGESRCLLHKIQPRQTSKDGV
ncbi:LRR receptor kinase BAK1-like [Salvia hispanica]|uniref:LRR receptor kinase BAK1-like n=1 Tax=Salvia hispanica TaxID=49212 RepID=UPI0020091E49|nr:LRR receptor kinase BAK1-like [Salvia hispanica]